MRNIVLFVNICDVFCDFGPLASLYPSKKQLERIVSSSKDVGLQLGTLLNITPFRRCFLSFVFKTNCHKLRNTSDFWLENIMFHNSLCVFMVVSALVDLFQLLLLHKSLVYPLFLHILYDECTEDVRRDIVLRNMQ